MHPITLVYLIATLAVVVIGVVYLARRTAWVLATPRKGWYIVYAIVLVYSFIMMSLCKYGLGESFFINRLIVIGSSLCGVIICLFLCLAVIETVHHFHYLGRKTFGAITLVSTFLLCAYGFINAAHPRVKTVEITLDNLHEPVTVAHLTDLHLGHFRGKDFVRLVADKTQALRPDIIVITGDLFESHYHLADSVIAPLCALNIPTFFVIGNHDEYVDGMLIKKLVARNGIRVLANEKLKFGSLYIGGVDFLPADSAHSNHMRLPENGLTVESVMHELKANDTLPYLMLAHAPVGAEYYEPAGVDLVLSGHTHGGQFFPLTVINHFAFEYNRGLHRYKNMFFYTSDGLGTTGFPMRTFTTSELTCIRLVPAKQQEKN
ncbi:MAG: metallophosphoesterase [Paludibacteraceae bacterium]|nr:metallophosphoesterase [Paludibacteraceae bacterium]